jgi:hypothetical protein
MGMEPHASSGICGSRAKQHRASNPSLSTGGRTAFGSKLNHDPEFSTR